MAINFVLGRDLNWDLLNYHAYVISDVFGERLERDFFAAGVQGYLNRIPYMLHSLLFKADLHSVLIASVVAAIHSLNVFFLYLISRALCAGQLYPRLTAAVVTGLGACSIPFLMQLGSTFIDPLTTPPILFALWLLLRSDGRLTWAIAGAMAGFSLGLKLTNAPFAAGILGAAILGMRPVKLGVPKFLAAIMGCAAGFVTSYGWWGWKLFSLHGSPFFPFFNGLFLSPDFIPHSLTYERFVPRDLSGIVLFPFLMAQHSSWIYVETIAPDLRPASLVVLGLALFARYPMLAASTVVGGSRSGLARLVRFFLVASLAWLLTSSNGRYAVPLLLLLGPLSYVASKALMGVRWGLIFLALLFSAQTFVVVDSGNQRWGADVWTHEYLPYSVPKSLVEQPYLYVAISDLSHSHLAAIVHPDSAFMNPIGLQSIPTEGPGWSRYLTIRDAWAGRTRVVFPIPPDGLTEAGAVQGELVNGAADRLGLHVDLSGCEKIVVNNPLQSTLVVPWGSLSVKGAEEARMRRASALAVCPAYVKQYLSRELASRRSVASKIMDAYEARCPGIFSPPGAQTEGGDSVWARQYGKFDLRLFVDFRDGGIYFVQQRQPSFYRLGALASWERDLEQFNCHLPHGGRRDIRTLNAERPR